MTELTTSQQEALHLLQEKLSSEDLRPTYVLTGPPGSGKSSVARRLGGEYRNFTLEWLDQFFATRSPLHLQPATLISFLLARITESTERLVILDGLESALVGLVPARRQEIAGTIQSLMRQSTGRKLVLVITSAPGSTFLTPGFADSWPDRDKIVRLEFTQQDALEIAARTDMIPDAAESASSFYDLLLPTSQSKE